MRLIDTNIFLRYLTGDDPDKGRDVLELLKRLERNREKATTNLLVIFEMVFTLEKFYKVGKREIRDLLTPILELRGLRFNEADIVLDAFDIFCEQSISFADAFNAAFMRAHGIHEIYSYDGDFDKIRNIVRVEPSSDTSL